jgi:ferrochelatase
MPESFIKKGDPYLDRTWETVKAVHEVVTRVMRAAEFGPWLDVLMAGGAEPKLVFQSKVGPIKWLGPEVAAETPRLAAAGLRSLFVQPVSFTCEHIETMLELAVELKEIAENAGIVDFRRGPALNLNPAWLDGLTDLLVTEAFAPEVGRIVADA